MSSPGDKRRYIRYHIPVPVMVKAPMLSDLRLIPEDLSASGFQVVVLSKPSLEMEIDCSVFVYEHEMKGIRAKPVWVDENELNPSTWIVGFEFVLPEDARRSFESHLRKILGDGN
ncbi:MAG: PilZ domain-containing protein [Candidatus Tectomicrobia bacterium]|uniref:PilZ domain-containing protein n=1 Tax=Tectimicrobiota bacterium TaxID=2528274 RepID=A0A932I068_UNCTE|nr:PilZ domain-containing protein [Candidatus Tectomicrobia bacterium]